MQAAHNLIKELGRMIGLDELSLDIDGQCTLAFDETIILTFVGDKDDGLNVVSYVADLPASIKAAKVLLAMNFVPNQMGGGRIALEPDSSRVVLVGRWDGIRTDFQQFQQELEGFVNAVESVRAELARMPTDEATSTAPAHSASVPPGAFA